MTKNIVLELVRIKKIETLIFERKLFKSNSSDQVILYTREGYGTICAVVNQL